MKDWKSPKRGHVTQCFRKETPTPAPSMLSWSSPGTKLKHGHKAPLSEPAASTHNLPETTIAQPWCWTSSSNTGKRSPPVDGLVAITNGVPSPARGSAYLFEAAPRSNPVPYVLSRENSRAPLKPGLQRTRTRPEGFFSHSTTHASRATLYSAFTTHDPRFTIHDSRFRLTTQLPPVHLTETESQ